MGILINENGSTIKIYTGYCSFKTIVAKAKMWYFTKLWDMVGLHTLEREKQTNTETNRDRKRETGKKHLCSS